MEKIVFYAKGVGLANRLRALCGYYALSRVLKRKFALCWVFDEACPASFEELFEEPDFPLLSEQNIDLQTRDRDCTIFTKPLWFHEIGRALIPAEKSHDFMEEVNLAFDQLRPVTAIANSVESFLTRHCFNGALGVHIRHTDNLRSYERLSGRSTTFRSGDISRLDGFFEHLDHRASLQHIFLSTDNSYIEQIVSDKYGARVITYPKEYTYFVKSASGQLKALLRTTSVVEALIEMLLLGKCSTIVGTYYSSFSMFAAIWSRREFWEVRGSTSVLHAGVSAIVSELKNLRNEG